MSAAGGNVSRESLRTPAPEYLNLRLIVRWATGGKTSSSILTSQQRRLRCKEKVNSFEAFRHPDESSSSNVTRLMSEAFFNRLVPSSMPQEYQHAKRVPRQLRCVRR